MRQTILFYMCFTMTKVKLLVILFYVNAAYASPNKHCEICSNHTLCKYPISGPSAACVNYERNSRLNPIDIKSLVNRINYRRNFIALHQSKYFPGAANMRKIVWSDDLAYSAQRWVDQCDPSTQPDKEDDCRNLELNAVGQNIATVTNTSSNFNIGSFIEVWYMQSLDYSGSVTYYNQSDYSTKYFTQLIWADTDSMGCGQASFYVNISLRVENLHNTLRRLVCNFAPQGNIHGKPIYIIGYPATQCPRNMIPDANFKGLCTVDQYHQALKSTSQITPVSSLLRIINFSNNSNSFSKNISKIQSNDLRTRSTLLNNTHAAVKRFPQHTFWEKSRNYSRHRESNIHEQDPVLLQQRLNTQSNFNTMNNNNDHLYENYNVISTSNANSNLHHRKHAISASCTRKVPPFQHESNNEYTESKCTREQKNECDQSQSRNNQYTKLPLLNHNTNRIMCLCNHYTTPTPCTEDWMNNMNCQCLSKIVDKQICSKSQRRQNESYKGESKKSSLFYYYDLLPNLHLREGDGFKTKNFYDKISTQALVQPNFGFVNTYRRKGNNPFYRKKRSDNIYTTTVPFWQMDDAVKKNTPHLKAIRYTTLLNKKLMHSRQISLTRSVEPISIRSTTTSAKQSLLTEKFLSFDELMQLRKMNMAGEYDARRQGSTTKATTTKTKEITANTPFVRMKHCTRKLTCTWTVTKMTDCNGSVILQTDGSNRGSRTPAGYVDGCTRTSTCTRDYMNRNKLASTTEDSSISTETIETEDDDYCERRSLQIHRRNLKEDAYSKDYELEKSDSLVTSSTNDTLITILLGKNKTIAKSRSDCLCNGLRKKVKRNAINSNILQDNQKTAKKKKRNERNLYENIHYGELYYLILRKVTENWEQNNKRKQLGQCFCNGNVMYENNLLLFFIILYDLLII